MTDDTTRRLRPHPYADRFPLIGPDDLAALADDIRANGLQQPLVRWTDATGETWLLDGRNRLRACEMAEVEPTWTDYTGSDPIAYIVSVNVQRRHLNTGQRAMAVAIGLAQQGKRQNGRFRRGSVPLDIYKSLNIEDAEHQATPWQVVVSHAGVVVDWAPELADPVLAGRLALDTAYREAQAAKAEADHAEERDQKRKADLARLQADAPDLARQVAEDGLERAAAVAIGLAEGGPSPEWPLARGGLCGNVRIRTFSRLALPRMGSRPHP